jgi:hypothetical protein
MSGCGCACHVGAGYRTWCEHCAPRPGNQCLVCFDHGDSSTAGELVTVHRGCLDALERHPDTWSEEAFDQQKSRAEAAEQRVRELEHVLREIESAETDWRLGVDANCEILRSIARRALTCDETT